MKVVGFVPIKLNSERLHRKNVREFRNGQPLLKYILKTLNEVKNLDEIYVYCSDESIKKYLPENVKFLKRDEYYDLSTTSFNEVLVSFAELIAADVYVLAHATAPFISSASIEKGIEMVKEQGYDSAFAVSKMQEFIWKNNRPFNYSLDSIPRTQDIDPLYVETCGLYVYERDLIMNKNCRIGSKPYLLEVSKIEAIDINEEEDFILADAIYNYNNFS